MMSSSDARDPSHAGGVQFVTLEASETPGHPGLLLEVLAKRIDGLHVRNVFTEEEVERAIPILESFRPFANPEPFGAMLGMPLYETADAGVRTAYLDSGDENRPRYREAFGFDPHQRLWDVLDPLIGDIEFDFAREDGREYNPGNVRWYDPAQGGLRTHAGNEFVEENLPKSLAHLATQSPVRDHLSYFVVLRESQIGGKLSVYELLYEDRTAEIQYWEDVQRDDSLFDAIPHLAHHPRPGDLTIFGGGWRYHRVDPVEGPVSRMTYGGFANVSHDGRRLHMWC
jgi:hypothetical protein